MCERDMKKEGFEIKDKLWINVPVKVKFSRYRPGCGPDGG